VARKKKPAIPSDPDAELLPPRKALSLLSKNPAADTGLLGDPTAGIDSTAPAAGGEETVSDQPQTITRDDSQTASSET
jgi:hypothetical protein